MAQFDPKLLAPAAKIEDANKRTSKQVALDNIAKMKEQLKAGDKAEGKLNFKAVGGNTEFTIRVGNSPLKLEVFIDGKPALSEKPSVPTAHFVGALDYFAGQINEGKYADQLAAADAKRTARIEKMRETRAKKPVTKK